MSDYTALLPPLSADEYEALKADIAERGCLVPVELDEDGQVLDGAHRIRACSDLGIKPPTITRRGLSEDEKRAHAIALNLQRRQLDREQRADLHRKLREAGKSLREIAEVSGVHPSTVADDVRGVGNPTPETITGRDGKSYPAKKVKPAPVLDFPEQPEMEAAETRERVERQQRRENRPAPVVIPPAEGTYSVLYADPPWRYDHNETPDLRDVENHYPTMAVEDICALDAPAADDAVLFLWATNPKLLEAFEVMEAWGFTYRTNACWVKDRFGMGYYVRGQHELLLIGKRGNIRAPEPSNRPSSVLTAPRQKHSQKPDDFYDLIEGMYPGHDKVELFARRPREGWSSWGNQLAAA